MIFKIVLSGIAVLLYEKNSRNKKIKKKKKIIEYKQNDDGICKDTAPVICFLLDDPTPRNNMLYTK